MVILRQPPPSNESKGCGFVKYTTREEAQAAINALNGQHIMEGGTAPLAVRFADTEARKRERMGLSMMGLGLMGMGGMMGLSPVMARLQVCCCRRGAPLPCSHCPLR